MDVTPEEVLARMYPSFEHPLAIARDWLTSGEEGSCEQAVELLGGLRDRYPDAPQVGQWLVLALVETGDLAAAETELALTEQLFLSPDEELLCRWGRLFREQAEKSAERVKEADDAALRTPIALYRKARDKYAEAEKVRHGHYPKTNVAELSLILAGLDKANRADEFRRAQQEATELLETRASWPQDNPADEFWHLATEAQAHMILLDWKLAAMLYGQAARHPKCGDRDRKSMRDGCSRVKKALRSAEAAESFGNLDDEERVFSPH